MYGCKHESMKVWMFVIFLLISGAVNAQTERVLYLTRADLCMDCTDSQLAEMALKLSPGYSTSTTETYVFLVDPVRQNYKQIIVSTVGRQKAVSEISAMAGKEQQTFAPLMRYGQGVQALKQAIAVFPPETLLNDESCDTALDAYTDKACEGELRSEVSAEARKQDIFNFRPFNYAYTLGGGTQTINSSVTISGQGSDGIVWVTFHWKDGSRTVFNFKDNVLTLNLALSVDENGAPLTEVIARLERVDPILGGEWSDKLGDKIRVWERYNKRFCNLMPGYKVIQLQRLDCRVVEAGTMVGADGKLIQKFEVECRAVGGQDIMKVYECR